jgi:hypothetical protein
MTANVPTRPRLTHRRRVQVGAALAAIPLVAVLAACGSSSSAAPAAPAAAPATTQGSAQGSNSGGSGGAPTIPGASGLIAAASPGTLQVQSSTAQNTVAYTSATTFTAITAGHIAAGDCVTVTGTPAAGSTQALTATSARIMAKVNGVCPTTGAGGGFGGAGSGRRPTGAPAGGSRTPLSFASATGTVNSVSDSTVLLHGVLRNGPSTTSSPASASTITITLGSSATVTQTVPATSAAAVVGQCARAIGPANSTGTITAKSITISKPGAGGCNTRFGGFGGRGTGSGANSTGNAASPNA